MMVSGSILTEAKFLMVSILSGAGMIFLYDFFRILRRVIRHGTVWIAIEDFLYWIFCALLIFAMLYQENDGLIRGFAMGGLLIGMFFYNRFVSPFFIRFAAKILGFILGILGKILLVFLKPLKKLKKLLKKLFKLVKIGLSKL